MKQALFLAAILLCSGVGQASGYNEIQCSDPSLFQYFDTEAEAERGCPAYDNVYVTYDYGYRKYTCGCTSPEGNGGGQ